MGTSADGTPAEMWKATLEAAGRAKSRLGWKVSSKMRSAAAESPGESAHDDADARVGLRFELPSRPGCGLDQFFGRVAEPHAILYRRG